VRFSPSIARDLPEELREARNGGGGTVRVATEETVSEWGPLAALGRRLGGYVVQGCAVAVTGAPRGPAELARPPGKRSRLCQLVLVVLRKHPQHDLGTIEGATVRLVVVELLVEHRPKDVMEPLSGGRVVLAHLVASEPL